MTLADQLHQLKENWLLAALVLLILLIPSFFSGVQQTLSADGFFAEKALAAPSFYRGGPIVPGTTDFAPGEKDRKITKTATIASEVEQGEFPAAEEQVKSIVASTQSYLLSQNVNTIGSDDDIREGTYQIKVGMKNYDILIQQLKAIGEVNSFTENVDDITGSYLSTQKELELEKQRLGRYQTILAEAQTATEKLEISDRIFNQERTITYLEDSLKNLDQQVSYGTVYLTIREELSAWGSLALVTLTELVQAFISSINTLLKLLITLIPYALAAVLLWWVIRRVRKR